MIWGDSSGLFCLLLFLSPKLQLGLNCHLRFTILSLVVEKRYHEKLLVCSSEKMLCALEKNEMKNVDERVG